MILYEQHYKLSESYLKKKINEFLEEDIPNSDITTEGILENDDIVVAVLEAQQDMIVAGANIIKYFFDDDFEVTIHKTDALKAKSGDIIAKIKGSAAHILKVERVMLNTLQRLCGIATETAKYVAIAKPRGVHILDTRKTTPGLRLFEKYAVSCGGGTNHRLDLSSGILIKDNHIKAAGSIAKAVELIRKKNYNMAIEVEVEDFDQLREAIDAKVDAFLLDNISPDIAKEAVSMIRNSVNGDKKFIECSGGITLRNLADYVRTGINAVSVGAITHSVCAANMHLEF